MESLRETRTRKSERKGEKKYFYVKLGIHVARVSYENPEETKRPDIYTKTRSERT